MDWEKLATICTGLTMGLIIVTFIVSLITTFANHKAGEVKDARVKSLQNRLEPYALTEEQRVKFKQILAELKGRMVAITARRAEFDTYPFVIEIEKLFREAGWTSPGAGRDEQSPPMRGVRISVADPESEIGNTVATAFSSIGLQTVLVKEEGRGPDIAIVSIGGKP